MEVSVAVLHATEAGLRVDAATVDGWSQEKEEEEEWHSGLLKMHRASYHGQLHLGFNHRFARPVLEGAAAAVVAAGEAKEVAREAVWRGTPLLEGPRATDGAAVTEAKLGACGAGEAWTAAARAAYTTYFCMAMAVCTRKR